MVGKYDFTTSSNSVKLWINPTNTTFGASNEPASGFISATNGTDGFTIDRFNIRQNIPTGSSSVPASMQWDELRIGLSWAAVTPVQQFTLTVPKKLGNGAFHASTITTSAGSVRPTQFRGAVVRSAG